ncbi:MAG: DUF4129 domain-containing protein [Chitinophagaceae bacterium]|nr:DUF4129 domain-containing protein [Chitinophagaceae bacterium]
MRKIIYISVVWMFFAAGASAQKKIIYVDTSLLQTEEEMVTPGNETIIVPAPADNITDEEEYEETEAVDTTLYQYDISLPYDTVKQWKNLPEYAYTKYIDSLLKNRKKKELKSTYSGPGILSRILGSGIVQLLFWMVVIVFVLFIIYRLFLADGVFQRRSTAAKNAAAEVEEEEIGHDTDFDALIRAALQNGKYRLAVRYQYLRTLHALAAKNFVELAPDKTNFQYVREITNPGHQNEFAALTLHYEYVWYGEFDIEKSIYQKIENNFTSFNKKI